MTPEETKACVDIRLGRAEETLDEARVLFEANMLKGAVNRIYYAIFYAVNALALANDFSTSSHSQLRGYFNKEFVKTGRVNRHLGETYSVAFNNRTKGDYSDVVTFEREQVGQMLGDAAQFIGSLVRLATLASSDPSADASHSSEPRQA